MSSKPQYMFIYKNDFAIDNLMEASPFRYENSNNIIAEGDGTYIIEFEHFDIRCIKRQGISSNMRGYRTWQVLVEGCLYDKLTNEQMDCILYPMMCPCSILGGRIIRI